MTDAVQELDSNEADNPSDDDPESSAEESMVSDRVRLKNDKNADVSDASMGSFYRRMDTDQSAGSPLVETAGYDSTRTVLPDKDVLVVPLLARGSKEVYTRKNYDGTPFIDSKSHDDTPVPTKVSEEKSVAVTKSPDDCMTKNNDLSATKEKETVLAKKPDGLPPPSEAISVRRKLFLEYADDFYRRKEAERECAVECEHHVRTARSVTSNCSNTAGLSPSMKKYDMLLNFTADGDEDKPIDIDRFQQESECESNLTDDEKSCSDTKSDDEECVAQGIPYAKGQGKICFNSDSCKMNVKYKGTELDHYKMVQGSKLTYHDNKRKAMARFNKPRKLPTKASYDDNVGIEIDNDAEDLKVNVKEDSAKVRQVEVNGQMVNTMKIPTGQEITVKFDPILSKEQLESEDFQVMKSRSEGNLTLSQRIGLLYDFQRKDFLSWWHPGVANVAVFLILRFILIRTYSNRNKTKSYLVAMKLLLMKELLQMSDKLRCDRGLRTKKEPSPLRNFRSYLEGVEEVKVSKAMRGVGSKKKRNLKDRFSQPGGSKTIFPVSSKIKQRDRCWKSKRLNYPCPMCSHGMLVAVDEGGPIFASLVMKYKQYDFAMAEWQENPRRKKSDKPLEPKGHPQQWIVCMCSVSKCLNRRTGSGCVVCEDFCKNGVEDGVCPWPIDSYFCHCEVCRCNCGVFFPLHKWQDVEFHKAELDAKEESDKKEKKKMSDDGKIGELYYTFFPIYVLLTHLLHLSPQSFQSAFKTMFGMISENSDKKHCMSSISQSVLTSKELNDDVALRTAIQNSLEDKTKLVKEHGTSNLVPINSLRLPGKMVKDTNRFVNNRLKSEVSYAASGPEDYTNEQGYSNPTVCSSITSPQDPSIPTHFDVTDDSIDACISGSRGFSQGSSSFPSPKRGLKPGSYVAFRPYRHMVLNKLKDNRATLRSHQRFALHRLLLILSGGEDDQALIVQTIASDSFSNSKWKDEFNMNSTVEIMMSIILHST